MPPDDRRCKADQKKGGRCVGWRMKERETCALHDAETHAKAQAKGAQAHSDSARERSAQLAAAQASIKLAAIEDIPATIERIAHQVAAGLIGDRSGGVLARLAAAAVAAHVAIDDLADKAHKRRIGMSDEQIQEALERLRRVRKQSQEQPS